MASGFHILSSPTKWTVHNEIFCTINETYTALLELWSEILEEKQILMTGPACVV